jgi:hypothetical protein
MSPQKKWLWCSSFLLVSGGFILGYWYVSLLGILLAALGGSPVAAVGFGLLLDLAYGAPLGLAVYLYFPFTILGAVLSVLRYLAGRYTLHFSAQERL